MKALDIIAYGGFAMAIIGLPFFLVNWLLYVISKARFRASPSLQKRLPIKSVLFFSVPVVVVLCAGTLSKAIGYQEVMRTISSLTNESRVSIEGRPVQNSGEVISILRTLHWIMPHHSDPTKHVNVEISDGSQNVALVLARDSHNPQEYWVFYPKYRITQLNEIGRIRTTLFDAY